MRAWAAGLTLALLGACATGRAEAEPPASLRDRLRARYAAELRAEPEAVADKLRKMARSNFSFFRGTLGLHPQAPSAFAHTKVAVFGDPHPENLGVFPQPGGDAIVDFDDFDQAGHGDFVDDLRRLALGVYVAGDAADLKKKQRARLVEAVCAGYAGEIAALIAGRPPVALRAATAFGGGLEDILQSDGAGIKEPVAAGDRVDARAVEQALGRARPTFIAADKYSAGYLSVKRAARARGGIASLLLDRIRVEVEGPSPAPGDDVVIELKETPGGRAPLLVKLQRELQERPDVDPLLGHTTLGDKAYRTRTAGSARRSVSIERLTAAVKSPRWGKRDFRGFASELGRVLARGHARATAPGGKPGLAALHKVVGDGQALTRETVEVTVAAAARLEKESDELRALVSKAPEAPLGTP